MLTDSLPTLIPLLLVLPITHAQSWFTPTVTWGPAYVAVEGKAFYIQGGQTTRDSNFINIPQAFSIDLSKPWDVTSPPYSKMQDGIAAYQHPNALMSDNESWLILANQTMYTYSLTNSPTTGATPVPEAISGPGFGAVINPVSSSFFVPNGYNVSGIQSSLEYSLQGAKSRSITSFPALVGYRFYAIARSNANAAYVFGGNRWDPPGGGDMSPNLVRYNFADSSWTPLYSQGPSARDSACLASAYGGTKLVLFGGIQTASALSDIFIYDIATNTWTQGQDGTIKRGRASAACTVSGDYFITYGGYLDKGTRYPPMELTSVYNLKTNTWATRYESPSAGLSAGSSAGPSAGAIAGGVVGGVAVISAIVLFVWYRKRRPKSDAEKQQQPPSPKSVTLAPKAEAFPLMVQQKPGTSVAQEQDHRHQLNLPMASPTVQEWPSEELRGHRGPQQYVGSRVVAGHHSGAFGEVPSSGRNPQAQPSMFP
ncbi:hypothetical protein BGZ52_002546 [Haplosporangium bisporale]|nr:hypothetical protein BGZ52_002546 [Haplosporangium bisporale]